MAVSDRVKSGPEKAPHRSLWKALGLTDEELKLPLIGVVSAKSECVPGHNHLNNIAQAVKDGIRLAGGVPVEFPAIGVCDGIAMGHVGMKYSHRTVFELEVLDVELCVGVRIIEDALHNRLA